MGGGSSVNKQTPLVSKKGSFLVQNSTERTRKLKQYDILLEKSLPEFYVRNVVVSSEEVAKAKTSWDNLIAGKFSNQLLEKIKSSRKEFTQDQSFKWFAEEFYIRFFRLCPEARDMFDPANTLAQGRLIGGVVSSALESTGNNEEFKYRMEYTAYKHFDRGVKPDHYGKMGSALVSTLEYILGSSFDFATKRAWQRIYSSMLDILLPIAISNEIEKSFPSDHQMDTSSSPREELIKTNSLNGKELRQTWSQSFKQFDSLLLSTLKSSTLESDDFSEIEQNQCPSPHRRDSQGKRRQSTTHYLIRPIIQSDHDYEPQNHHRSVDGSYNGNFPHSSSPGILSSSKHKDNMNKDEDDPAYCNDDNASVVTRNSGIDTGKPCSPDTIMDAPVSPSIRIKMMGRMATPGNPRQKHNFLSKLWEQMELDPALVDQEMASRASVTGAGSGGVLCDEQQAEVLLQHKIKSTRQHNSNTNSSSRRIVSTVGETM